MTQFSVDTEVGYFSKSLEFHYMKGSEKKKIIYKKYIQKTVGQVRMYDSSGDKQESV